MRARYGLRFAALTYLMLLLVLPVGLVFYRTFQHGLEPVWNAMTDPDFLHALWLTLLIALIAVPLNTIFGVACALVLVRQRFRGKAVLNALVDLPLRFPRSSSASRSSSSMRAPGGSGLGSTRTGSRSSSRCRPWSRDHLRLAPVRGPRGRAGAPRDRHRAGRGRLDLGASPLATFRRITLPAIRWGVTYGVVLTTARCLGEFGAVSVVSGNLIGKTQTLTLHVNNRFQAFDLVGAYTASVVLAVLALMTLFLMNLFRKETPRVDSGPRRDEALR